MRPPSRRSTRGQRLARLAFFAAATLLGLRSSPARAAEALDGYWLSDGYGYLAEIRGGRLALFQVTPFSCMASGTLTEKAEPPDPRGRRFASEDRSSVLFLSAGPSDDSEWFGDPEAASKVLFRRTAARPEICGRPTPNDPRTNFEIFAWTFGAHHGFLELRRVDWPAVTAAARAKVSVATKPKELFRILSGMIEPLHDRHTGLEAPDLHEVFSGKRPDTLVLTKAEQKRTVEILETKYLQGKLRSWCRDHVRYGRLKAGPGYLRVDAFYGYTPKGGFDEGARALDAALDEVVADLRDLPGLIVDVRLNGGGADPYGIQIAGRLTESPYVAYVKRARNDPLDPEKWTEPQPATVRPSARSRYAGRVVELIGSDTVSAGETFTMALMGRSPAVTRVGQNTQGVYSDVLDRRLPNGWRFLLPNEVFLTERGEHFEARGVPPHFSVPVFSREDLAASRDSAIEKAVDVLAADAAPVKRD